MATTAAILKTKSKGSNNLRFTLTQQVQKTDTKIKQEEIYRDLIEIQGRTHSQQAGVLSYLKTD